MVIFWPTIVKVQEHADEQRASRFPACHTETLTAQCGEGGSAREQNFLQEQLCSAHTYAILSGSRISFACLFGINMFFQKNASWLNASPHTCENTWRPLFKLTCFVLVKCTERIIARLICVLAYEEQTQVNPAKSQLHKICLY